VIETRDAVLDGRTDINVFKRDPGVINAEIIEECGRVLMRKICQIHGPFEDVLATDAAFFRRMERLYPGPDFAPRSRPRSCVRYGRGAFLVFDLTNRCNMKCWPRFMDANAVGHVHELDLDNIKRILERARSFKPQREVNILFSGGEPTISHFPWMQSGRPEHWVLSGYMSPPTESVSLRTPALHNKPVKPVFTVCSCS
jgi:7,8-dihydro-6-hydroxymethylpterin dimethyltransferase